MKKLWILKEDSDAQEFHEFEQNICICFKDWITTLLKGSKLGGEIILVIEYLYFKHWREQKIDKYVPNSTLIINSEGWPHEVPYTNNEQSFVSNL